MFLPGCDAILDSSIGGHACYVYVSNLCLLHLCYQVTRQASFFKKFEGKVDKKPIEDDVSEDQDEETTCHAPEEAEAPQRRYPIRNRRQKSFYEAVQGVSKATTQTF